jgi:gas vesicle protein
MSENNDNSRLGGYVTAFAIGAALGAGVALLYAPRSGKDTRKLLTKKGRELKDKAGDLLEDATDLIQEKKAALAAALESGKEVIREGKAKLEKVG